MDQEQRTGCPKSIKADKRPLTILNIFIFLTCLDYGEEWLEAVSSHKNIQTQLNHPKLCGKICYGLIIPIPNTNSKMYVWCKKAHEQQNSRVQHGDGCIMLYSCFSLARRGAFVHGGNPK